MSKEYFSQLDQFDIEKIKQIKTEEIREVGGKRVKVKLNDLNEPDVIRIIAGSLAKYSKKNGYDFDLLQVDISELSGVSTPSINKYLSVIDPQNQHFKQYIKPTSTGGYSSAVSIFRKFDESTIEVIKQFCDTELHRGVSAHELEKFKAFEETANQKLTIQNISGVISRELDDLRAQRDDYRSRIKKLHDATANKDLLEIDDSVLYTMSHKSTLNFNSVEETNEYCERLIKRFSSVTNLSVLERDESLIPEGELKFEDNKLVITRQMARNLIFKLTGEQDVSPFEVVYKLFLALKQIDK